MKNKILANKINIILILALLIIVIGGFLGYQRLISKDDPKVVGEEVDMIFDPEGPFAILTPRRDGNAMIVNIKRTASYDKINYELVYSDKDGVDRGVGGDVDTKEKKGEYEQEVLFGTCSKNVCKYDEGVGNGTINLHIVKGINAYRMTSQWTLQKPDLTLGALVSGDGHFVYKIDVSKADLTLIKYVIVNDLTGAPKLPADKTVIDKVYSVNAVVAKDLPGGVVTIELAEKPSEQLKIARFDEGANQWQELETTVNGSKLESTAPSGGVFAVLSSI